METPALPVKVKVCSGCGDSKDVSCFHTHRQTRDKLRAKCKECTNKENKQWAEENQDKRKSSHYNRTYGLSYQEIMDMHRRVNNLCEICSDKKELLHVDHSHSSGKVRGLLCMRCNLLLGKIEENSNLFPKLFDYLEKYKDKP